MKIVNRKIIAGLLPLLFVVFTDSSSYQHRAQNAPLDKPLDQLVPDMEPLQDVTTEQAFARLLVWAHMSGGIVEVENCLTSADRPPVKHSHVLAGLTLRQALDLIVADDARYRWTEEDQVVDLVPMAGPPEVLKTKLTRFEISPDESVESVSAKLFDTQEVKQALAGRGLAKGKGLELIIGGAPSKLAKRRMFEDIAVMDVLNAAAADNKYPAVWQYTEYLGQCKQTYYLEWPVGTPVTHLRE